MQDIKKIAISDFESMLPKLDNKPYLIIVCSAKNCDNFAQKNNINFLSTFNQAEMSKDLTTVFLLMNTKKFKQSYKGFMYVFMIKDFDELNESIFLRNRVFRIV